MQIFLNLFTINDPSSLVRFNNRRLLVHIYLENYFHHDKLNFYQQLLGDLFKSGSVLGTICPGPGIDPPLLGPWFTEDI